MIAIVLQVPLVNGKPDVDMPASVSVEKQGDVVVISHEASGEAATFKFLGTANGEAILAGMASKNVAQWLSRQGITVTRIRDATAGQKTWLAARGVTKENAGHTFCGWPNGDVDEVVP